MSANDFYGENLWHALGCIQSLGIQALQDACFMPDAIIVAGLARHLHNETGFRILRSEDKPDYMPRGGKSRG
ncbi:hypothetical protein ARTHROSP310_14170 [Arthrobacter sp. AD-310]